MLILLNSLVSLREYSIYASQEEHAPCLTKTMSKEKKDQKEPKGFFKTSKLYYCILTRRFFV
jgi:hypothetical protein